MSSRLVYFCWESFPKKNYNVSMMTLDIVRKWQCIHKIKRKIFPAEYVDYDQ
jgi:hypothetical protein